MNPKDAPFNHTFTRFQTVRDKTMSCVHTGQNALVRTKQNVAASVKLTPDINLRKCRPLQAFLPVCASLSERAAQVAVEEPLPDVHVYSSMLLIWQCGMQYMLLSFQSACDENTPVQCDDNGPQDAGDDCTCEYSFMPDRNISFDSMSTASMAHPSA